MKLRNLWLAFMLLFTAFLVGCDRNKDEATPSQEPANSGLAVGDAAPDFSLPSTDGQLVALADYVNKQPVLLYFHMAVG